MDGKIIRKEGQAVITKIYAGIAIICLMLAITAVENGFYISSIALGITFYMFGRWAAIEEGVWR